MDSLFLLKISDVLKLNLFFYERIAYNSHRTLGRGFEAL